jgi:hypothetical protein
LGIIGYLVTGAQSVTALIPAFFAVLVVVVMLVTKRLKDAASLWTLVIMGTIGFLATVSGVPKMITWAGGEEIERPAAVVSQTIMAIASLVFGLVLFAISRKDEPAR